MSDAVRKFGMALLRTLAQLIGGLLVIFGGGCVVIAAMGGVGPFNTSTIVFVVLAGVIPLILGLALHRWGTGQWGQPWTWGRPRRPPE